MKENRKKKEYILEYDLIFVNVLSIVLLAIMILLTIILFNVLPSSLVGELTRKFTEVEIENNFMLLYVIFFIVMIFWMVLHEIIHSIAYQMTGAKSENIVFGVALEKGVFYCKCKEYISKKCIITSLLSPFIIIGVLTYILGFIINSSWLIILSIINISGAAGDLMMFAFFLKQKDDIEFKELGYSSPFVLRTSDNLAEKKFLGIKSIKEVTDSKETKEDPEKKLTITKPSWIFIIIMLVLLGLMIGIEGFNKSNEKKNDNHSEKYNELLRNEKTYELAELYLEKNKVWDIKKENFIDEYPNLSFKFTSDAKTHDNIYLIQDDKEKNIISGVPIMYTYKTDLTGDGRPEVIANVMFGYGMCDSHIEVYDIYNDTKYVLWDRGNYDYYLYYVDEELKVIKISYDRSAEETYQGILKFVKDENNSASGYLTIENEKEI